jgi:hypothetical protein
MSTTRADYAHNKQIRAFANSMIRQISVLI